MSRQGGVIHGMDAQDHLAWLAEWYREQCNGVWEHTLGLHLDMLPPPVGPRASAPLRLTIELTGTSAAGLRSRAIMLTAGGVEQLRCTLNGERFRGECERERLEQLLGIFRRWVCDEQASRPGRTRRPAVVAAASP